MKIYITRHGETIWNKENRRQGWLNSDLSVKGIEETKRLGESLKHIPFERIYCSPLGRAIETAKLIKGDRSIPMVVCENLKEMNFGVWEGMANDEIDEHYREQNFNLWNRPHLYETKGGESFDTLFARVEKALDEIIAAEAHTEGNVLLVTHGVTKKAIYKIVNNTPLDEFWGPPLMHNTCLSVLEVQGNQKHFVLEADISHLVE